MPAGVLPTFIFHATCIARRSSATISSLPCSVTNANAESFEYATCDGIDGISKRLASP